MNASRYLSYLDLMCCGFGGAVLMFLIVASSRPEQRPTDQILVVRCRTDWERAGSGTGVGSGGAASGNGAEATGQGADGTQPPRAEVGIEYRRGGELVWQRGKPGEWTGDSWTFVAPSGDGSGSETVLVWRQPARGRWEFRPYLIDFPSARVRGTSDPGRSSGQTSTSLSANSVPVTLEARGRRLRTEGDSSSQLQLPGDTGATLKVDLL